VNKITDRNHYFDEPSFLPHDYTLIAMIDDDIPALTQFTQLFTNKNAQNIEKRNGNR
jgi:hypothetical protein